MKTINIIRLLSLAAIWGSSFIFLRILSPILNPIITTNLRIIIAGGLLCLYYFIVRFDCEWKKNWKHYLIVGVVNSAIPFGLFAYGALYLPASFEVILNSTAPIFGAVFAWIWLKDVMNWFRVMGLLIACLGVALVVNLGAPTTLSPNFISAVIACLAAAACYGISGIYIKKYASHIKPLAFAGCSQLLAGIVFIPLSYSQLPIPGVVTPMILFYLLVLSLLCSAVAYLLYYKLITEVGPTKALTVTFLMPIFGMIWGALFLNETITEGMILGTVFILAGTYLVFKIRIA